MCLFDMKKYLNKNTRLVLKLYLPALGYVLALQRKNKFMWLTVSWIYPSIVKTQTCIEIIDWLKWNENRKSKSDMLIGREIMKKCNKYGNNII